MITPPSERLHKTMDEIIFRVIVAVSVVPTEYRTLSSCSIWGTLNTNDVICALSKYSLFSNICLRVSLSRWPIGKRDYSTSSQRSRYCTQYSNSVYQTPSTNEETCSQDVRQTKRSAVVLPGWAVGVVTNSLSTVKGTKLIKGTHFSVLKTATRDTSSLVCIGSCFRHRWQLLGNG